MTTSLESIYEEIGLHIVKILPDGWLRALIIAEESEPGVRALKGWYESDTDPSPAEFVVGPSITRLMTEAENRLRKPGAPLWKKITFTLEREGRFDLRFEE